MTSMKDFEQVIGLEVHVQLNTATKIFVGSKNDFGLSPNSLTDPVTLGLPGALPVINEKVLESAIMLGLTTNCSIRRFTRFARKHYFYPDLPKGYQISQYEEPICEHGFIELAENKKKIGITRIHMEEDAGKSIHFRSSSLVDLNRAGTPLLEIVSEPDMRSALEAIEYIKILHQLVTYLNICNGNMEQGNFRCDVNISVRKRGRSDLGTKTEIKNLNSFKFIERAIEYETNRHLSILTDGGTIKQETVLFDSDAGITRPMRGKEDAADYRYFPDPDLPPIILSDEFIDKIKSQIPELPRERMARFETDYELSRYDAEILTLTKSTADYFEAAISSKSTPKLLCNWIVSELFALLNKDNLPLEQSKVSPESLGKLVRMIEDGSISGKIGKQILLELYKNGGDPEEVVNSQGLSQMSNSEELKNIVGGIICNHPSQFKEFVEGKDSLLGFFVGQVMKATKGKANPELTNIILKNFRSTPPL